MTEIAYNALFRNNFYHRTAICTGGGFSSFGQCQLRQLRLRGASAFRAVGKLYVRKWTHQIDSGIKLGYARRQPWRSPKWTVPTTCFKEDIRR